MLIFGSALSISESRLQMLIKCHPCPRTFVTHESGPYTAAGGWFIPDLCAQQRETKAGNEPSTGCRRRDLQGQNLHGEIFPFPTVGLGPMEGEHYLRAMRQRFGGEIGYVHAQVGV